MSRRNLNPQHASLPVRPVDDRQARCLDGETSFFERNLPTVYKIFNPSAGPGADRRGNDAIPKSRLKVLVADEHRIMVDGLAALLRHAGYQHPGFGTEGEEVLRALAAEPPDVAIIDFWLPGIAGLDIVRSVKACRLPVRIILLAAGLSGAQAVDAVRLGTEGLLMKGTAAENLLECLAAVAAGEQWLCPLATRLVLQELSGGNGAPRGLAGSLTRRETDVVYGVARGRSNKELARDLLVSEGTIKMHLHNVYEKLGLRNRTELAIAARGNGFS